MLKEAAVVLLAVQALVVYCDSECPDRDVCQENHTCCQGPTGEYSCCPHHQGECCDDHLFCCPEHTVCLMEEEHPRCVNATVSLPRTERIPARQSSLLKSLRVISASPEIKDAVVCPDRSFCPAEFSCVKLPITFGCCPITQGIVCADGKHCCPEGLECSSDGKSCVQPREPVAAVICSDGKSECPQGASCCQSSDGVWGCCPLPRAVCCDDKEHCCPEDSTCDVENSKCISSTNQHLPMWSKFPARLRANWEDHNGETTMTPAVTAEPEQSTDQTVTAEPETTSTQPDAVAEMATEPSIPAMNKNVPCDDTVACEDGNTCCKNGQGGWACCPLPKAVCCEDHEHCCPEGTTCDLPHNTCQNATVSVPMLMKLPALALPPKENNVTCDSTSSCPDGTTCCKNEQGQWACCPLPEAVCCEDHVHCCPKGTTCDVAAGTCQSATGPVPMLTKLPALALPPKENNVTCDSTSSCPDGTTCCKNEQGQWACCPLPEAVCCEDHVHCCPKGTTCDVAAGTCQSATGPVPMLTKLPALALPPKENNVTCDSTSSCSDGTTCCKNEQGQWACCPLPEAVCCEDHIHCCPKGMTCDVKASTCNGPSGSVPMLSKLPATAGHPEVKAPCHSQCDSTTSCPDHSTCCFMKKENKWGCCPFENAICCEDDEHCCPAGYKCGTDTCTKGDVVIPWYNKLPAQGPARSSEPVAAVTCDSNTSCPSGSSCCQLSNGNWGCCPLTEAVCCSDQAHCCPQGYTCNLQMESCEKSVLFQAQMLPLIRLVEQEPEKSTAWRTDKEVQCDDDFSCQDQETCCRAEGGWGCCPAPKATCCADRKHCCPAGYTCGEGGTCIQATSFHKDNWRVFFSKKKRALVY